MPCPLFQPFLPPQSSDSSSSSGSASANNEEPGVQLPAVSSGTRLALYLLRSTNQDEVPINGFEPAAGGGAAAEVGSLWMSSRLDLEYGAGGGFCPPTDRGSGGGGLTVPVVEPSIKRSGRGRRRAGLGIEDSGETKRAEAGEGGSTALPHCAATTATPSTRKESWMEWLERPSEKGLKWSNNSFMLKTDTKCLSFLPFNRHHWQDPAPPFLLERPLPGARGFPGECALLSYVQVERRRSYYLL